MTTAPRVLSPMPTGSGAIVVHRMLESLLDDYRVVPYSPWWTLCPPAIARFSRQSAAIIHTSVDYGIFSSRPGRRLVVTFHNYVLDAFMRPYSSRLQWLHYRSDLRLFSRMALRHADVVTAVSHATASLVRDDLGYSGELIVIPNGVDTNRFKSAPYDNASRAFTALFSGNVSTRKGGQWLPAIASGLDESQRILCIGKGAVAEGGQGRIEFHPAVPHSSMPAFYASCDALLMPTVREGMSLAALEAMACGLPVVATDCPSMRELIVPGEGGFLCPLGDPSAFAACLRELAAAPALRQRMGAFNRRRAVESYDARGMAAAYRSIFDRLSAG